MDVSALRHERAARRGHHMLAHLRTEAYPVYGEHRYPPKVEGEPATSPSFEGNCELIDESKRRGEGSR